MASAKRRRFCWPRAVPESFSARRADRLQTLAQRIAQNGGEAAWAPTDVTRRDDVAALVNLARERFGRLDVLVNNAGIAPTSPLDELRVDDWDEMIDVNIKGVLYGIAAALPVFREQEFGHFVNTASTAGLITKPTMAVYSGTKFAVRAISEVKAQIQGTMDKMAIPPDAIARAIAFAIEQPPEVDVNEIVVRPTAQS